MDVTARVKSKYPFWTDEQVAASIEKAKAICIDELFPADMSVSHFNFEWEQYPRLQAWICDCVDELAERAGISSVVAYKENGISMTFDRAQVSKALLSRLSRHAYAVKNV